MITPINPHGKTRKGGYMHKLRDFETDQKITVGISGLQSMLCVGRNTAAQIGKEAGAVLHVGRRTLYNVDKIKKYMDTLTEA